MHVASSGAGDARMCQGHLLRASVAAIRKVSYELITAHTRQIRHVTRHYYY